MKLKVSGNPSCNLNMLESIMPTRPIKNSQNAILNRNDLVVLAPDVFRNKCLRIVVFDFVVTIGD